jgi:hypothetical protein
MTPARGQRPRLQIKRLFVIPSEVEESLNSFRLP